MNPSTKLRIHGERSPEFTEGRSRTMNYLFTGEAPHLKKKAVNKLKFKLLPGDSSKLNFNIYYAGTDRIEDILCGANTLPFSGKFRIIVVKDINKFTPKEKRTLLEYLKKPNEKTCFVLECDKEFTNDGFLIKLTRFTKRINFIKSKEKELLTLDKRISKKTIDILLDAISRKDTDKALDIVSNLILRNIKPHEIIGLLAWHFRKSKRNPELLLSADLAIKRGRLKPALVLEFAILELCR